MFLGTYEPKLDDKGRMILPAKFRDQLADGLVLAPAQERCLTVFPESEFVRVLDELVQAPTTLKNARSYSRMLLANASDQKPDRQGRVTIPANLRDYAHLERELAVIGVGNRAEIWDATAWREYQAAQEEVFADTEEEIIPGLL